MERPKVSAAARNLNYDFKYTSNPFGFKVIRKSDKQVIFDTTEYPLVFEDQYLEVSTAVPRDTNLYGLGEVIGSFRRNNVHVSLLEPMQKFPVQVRYSTVHTCSRMLPLFLLAMLPLRKFHTKELTIYLV